MRKFSSLELLIKYLIDLYYLNNSKRLIVFISGLSRSGKTTLTMELQKGFLLQSIMTTVVKLDSWLIDVDKRNEDSTVIERYEIDKINRAINDLLKGHLVYPPIYNEVTRKRIEGEVDSPLEFKEGILIVEGVVALSLEDKFKERFTSIYVEIDDFIRLKRLINFYKYTKKLSKSSYKSLIFDREVEETPFIRSMSKKAQIIFKWSSTN